MIKDLNKNSNYTFGTPIYSSSQGYRTNRTTSLDLNKGKYMVYVTSGHMGKPSNTPASSRSGLSNNEITFTCDSCKYNKISGYFTVASATAKDQNTGYNCHNVYTDIYTLEVSSTTDTVSASYSTPTATWATS